MRLILLQVPERIRFMKNRVVVSSMILTLLCPSYVAGANSFEDEATPIEQEDMKTVDQIKGDTSFEDEATPIEQDDIKSIQINQGTSFEDESTPIEQDDMKTIDQINKSTDF